MDKPLKYYLYKLAQWVTWLPLVVVAIPLVIACIVIGALAPLIDVLDSLEHRFWFKAVNA